MQTHVKYTNDYQNKIIKLLESAPDAPKFMWSEFEDSMIKRFYKTKGAQPIAKALGRNNNQVIRRANTLGIRRKH